jgi:transposase
MLDFFYSLYKTDSFLNERTMENHAYVGIDVAKGTADFLLVNARKEILEQGFVLDDCTQGRKVLTQLIDGWFAAGITHLYCGVESTGGYENNWFTLLCSLAATYDKKNKTLRVARVNPRPIKACGQAAMLRTQTDQTSALAIASYLIGFPEKVRYSPGAGQSDDPVWLAARGQAGLIRMLIKQKSQLSSQLEKLLYSRLGELMIYCRNGTPGWLLRLLSRYPSREHLHRAGLSKVASINGISLDKARRLLGKLDGGHPATPSIACHTIKATAGQILHLQTQIDAQQAYLSGLFKDHPDVRLLETIKSIGLDSAVRLMVEIEEVSRFGSGKALCAYFGVHPTWKESGDGHWKTGMSKQGRAQVRGILYMCSLSAIRWNPDMKRLYHRFRKKGMNHYQAMGVVMHKLLRIIYGVLKNQSPYNPQVDRDNRQRSEEKQQAYQEEAVRKKKVQRTTRQRYMSNGTDSTENAPISRRAYQKRKQEASQSSLVEEYTGSPPAD